MRLVFASMLIAACVAATFGQVRRPVVWDEDIDELTGEDAVSPPPQNAILFAGSSTIRLWTTLDRDMAPLPVINRGFGGSRSWELLYYMDRIVLPYKPAIIVYYEGGNDVAYGVGAAEIADNFRTFTERVAAAFPNIQIFFMSIIKAPENRDLWSVVDEANGRVRQYSEGRKNVGYIDLNRVVFDKAGEPRVELYLPDRLHFNVAGYAELTKIVRPIIEKAWQQSSLKRRDHE